MDTRSIYSKTKAFILISGSAWGCWGELSLHYSRWASGFKHKPSQVWAQSGADRLRDTSSLDQGLAVSSNTSLLFSSLSVCSSVLFCSFISMQTLSGMSKSPKKQTQHSLGPDPVSKDGFSRCIQTTCKLNSYKKNTITRQNNKNNNTKKQ